MQSVPAQLFSFPRTRLLPLLLVCSCTKIEGSFFQWSFLAPTKEVNPQATEQQSRTRFSYRLPLIYRKPHPNHSTRCKTMRAPPHYGSNLCPSVVYVFYFKTYDTRPAFSLRSKTSFCIIIPQWPGVNLQILVLLDEVGWSREAPREFWTNKSRTFSILQFSYNARKIVGVALQTD